MRSTSVSTSNSKKRSHTPDNPKKHRRNVSKGLLKRPPPESEGANSKSGSVPESDSESEGIGVDEQDCKIAGRAIARCHDMFADINTVIDVVLLSRQAAENGTLSDSEDEGTREHREQFLSKLSASTVARYKRIYAFLLCLVPGFKVLIDNPSRSGHLKIAVQKINHAINEARSSDAGKLWDKIVAYTAPNPNVASLSPPIPTGSDARSQMGLNHPVLAAYLCPVNSLAVYLADAEGTRKKLESGKIKMSATNFPAFLWEDCGRKFDTTNIFKGFFHGFYIECVTRHIFTGPSTGMGGDPRGSKPNNSELNHMDQVSGAQLAYAAVQARFAISSKSWWLEKDGLFEYHKFYYGLIDLIDGCKNTAWREALLKHYNVLLFQDEKGRQKDIHEEDNNDGDVDGPSLLSMMRAQAAAAASSSATDPNSLESYFSDHNAAIIIPAQTSNSIPEVITTYPNSVYGSHSSRLRDNTADIARETGPSSNPLNQLDPAAIGVDVCPSSTATVTQPVSGGYHASSHPPNELASNSTDGPSHPATIKTQLFTPELRVPRPIMARDKAISESELSELEDEEKNREEKRRKIIRKGKRKVVVPVSADDEDVEPPMCQRRKVSKKAKK